MKRATRKYLASMEYEMGNGQCPRCFGADPTKFNATPPNDLGFSSGPHPCFPKQSMKGHRKDCELADALISAGINAVFRTEEPPK